MTAIIAVKPMRFFITGTDTDIGKTMVSAMLVAGLQADYWKPVQSGIEGGTDTETVARLTALPADHYHPESWRLTAPLSPHRSAELDQVTIDPDAITIPATSRPLIIEGAGGLMVPLNRQVLLIDLIQQWQVPVILCARTRLGTINHTLLSLGTLHQRGIPLHGIIFIGDDNPDTIRTIGDFGQNFGDVRILGRLPWLENPSRETLLAAFADHFRHDDFIL